MNTIRYTTIIVNHFDIPTETKNNPNIWEEIPYPQESFLYNNSREILPLKTGEQQREP